MVTKSGFMNINLRKTIKPYAHFNFKENTLGLMIIFGKDERTKVEEIRNDLSPTVLATYDSAEIYHDIFLLLDIIILIIATTILKIRHIGIYLNHKSYTNFHLTKGHNYARY